MVAAGLMTIMCSLEICLRLYKANKRVQDPDLDNLTNPHEVKHWMDPNIIPYGWGLFDKSDRVEKAEESPSCVILPILAMHTVSGCVEDQVGKHPCHYEQGGLSNLTTFCGPVIYNLLLDHITH